MSEKIVVKCDLCGLETYYFRKGLKVPIRFIRTPDPSGNGYITETIRIDICEECIGEIVMEAYKKRKIDLTFSKIFHKL